ncbi:MAG: 16S rRNA (guanine(966)-N(2))-methyltransferase RsmD [Leptospirillia bacterium]
MAGDIRIIAGALKGRRLVSVSGREVRPTSARVREAVFSVLGDRVQSAQVLDLFAGIGSLGLEALSRGAEHVDFVENNGRHLAAIHDSVEKMGLETQASLIKADAARFISRLREPGRYDLVFFDPPYGAEGITGMLASLARSEALMPNGVVVVEHDVRASPEFGLSWEVGRTYNYGKTAITLLSPVS